MPLKIGNIKLKHGLILAPMAGVTDRAYRHICRRCGAEMTVTEMVSAKALCYNDQSSYELAKIDKWDTPASLQLFGHEPEVISEAIKRAFDAVKQEDSAPAVIDINMGCPVKKIVSNGDGSSLMKNPKLASQIVSYAVKASPVPVTVKIRTGWNEASKNAVEFSKIMEQSGVSAITIHGRTREQMYSPPVDIDTISEVKNAVKIPVIANGGINTVTDAIEMIKRTGCDGLMLARGTMGNPWLFDEIAYAMDCKAYIPLSMSEKIKFAIEQVKEMVQYKGERTGILEARRQIAYYIKGERGSAEIRAQLNRASSFDEIVDIISEYIN